eukprot:4469698-Prymnesium_polylepis.1
MARAPWRADHSVMELPGKYGHRGRILAAGGEHSGERRHGLVPRDAQPRRPPHLHAACSCSVEAAPPTPPQPDGRTAEGVPLPGADLGRHALEQPCVSCPRIGTYPTACYLFYFVIIFVALVPLP